MSIYPELSYEHDFDTIKGIQFCVLSPEEIVKRSVVEVTKTETYNGNEPVYNGLFDPRMGVIDHNKVCVTCEQKNTFCPGHFGHITLAKPVFYVQFFDIVKKLLRCVCFKCGKLLVDPDSDVVKNIVNKKYSRQKRWELIHKECARVKRCGHSRADGCGVRIPNITKESVMKIGLEWRDAEKDKGGDKGEKTATKMVLNAEDVLKIIRRISEKDAEILGFHRKYNRPEWMICTVLPVPPPAVRPSVRTDTGQRQEDDLTHKLSMIVKYNNNLKSRIEKANDKPSKDQVDMYTMLLQYEVATMIDNTIPGIPQSQQRTGRPIRSLTERLKSKEGRIRGNLMGKRVDFSARSVITPDPNISIDELGVPLKIAMNLTYPEIVNDYNKDELLKMVRSGPDVYPGAKFVRKTKQNLIKRLKSIEVREGIELENGDVVERHLKNGDYVLFNRQPSLHRLSMLAHRVRVMPYNTFRLNVCVTPSYNADFDGDEMNLHAAQSYQTHEELKQLCSVPTQIISPRESKPIVSIVQDIVSGLYRMTKGHVRISEKQLFNLMCPNPKFIGIIPKPSEVNGSIQKWTGRQALSTVIPEKVNIDIKTDAYDDSLSKEQNNDAHIKVVNGEVLSGTFSKDIYQGRTKGLIHSVYNEYGPEETRMLFDNTQKMTCDWLVLNGFSVGISDLIVDTNTTETFKKTITDMKVKVYDTIMNIHKGKFENISTKTNAELFEEQVNGILNKAINTVGQEGRKQIDENTNRLINMIKAKAKGTEVNVAQMMGCVGQQNVDGKRIPYGFDGRTLPHYNKYDDGPESRGFIESSFITGLTPQEFFFAAMGGREGLIDTAVQSVTGETPIIIIEDGSPKYVRIGDWIDAHLDVNRSSVKHFTDRRMELLDLNNNVYIPTTDYDGNVTWGEVTAVTRHDPGTELYQVKTAGGRSVIVTESKSLLIWHDSLNQFKEVPTPEIQVGDALPVSARLASPPVVITCVDMVNYFPKSEYVYGSEFKKATKMIEFAMQGRCKIPVGWWQKHNGSSFTLPYTSKARVVRTIKRSNTLNIIEGCIYPYHATREHACIPATFKLSYDNGVFIGVYLADGSTCVSSGKVNIASSDPDVRAFVSEWFANLGISTSEETHINSIGGTSTSVNGYNVMLARFLDMFVGHGAANKYIPNDTFGASDEFVLGLLSGYFSCDGTIGTSSVECGSTSSRLTEGISMLCSRLGVFGKVFVTRNVENNLGTKDILPMHRLAIRAQWAHMFASKVCLLSKRKNQLLQEANFTSVHRNFRSHNDVVLDKIVEINIVNAKDYPKVYDLTIPSTLNFGLANGLQVRDTSETGYIQRKLVKAMEDCKVNYDMTVRNANGNIIQFLYGEDGMDACKIESQPIPYIDLGVDAIKRDYMISEDCMELEFAVQPEIVNKIKKNKAFQNRMKEHVDQLLQDRLHLITKVFKGTHESSVMYPVCLNRILNNSSSLHAKYGCDVMIDLDPIKILDSIDQLCKELYVSKNHPGNMMFQILLRAYLSPKKILLKYRLDNTAFDYVVEQIKYRFYESMAHPSEMVGVVAAQSIGEPSTQLSILSYTNILVKNVKSNQIYKGPVNAFIDKILDQNPKKVVDLGNDSVVMDTSDYEIIGVSEQEKTSWKRISQVSRHPANGGMVRIHTRSGKTTCATLSHSFLKRVENGVAPVKGSDLKMGDRVPVAKNIPVIDKPMEYITLIDGTKHALDRDLGWLCGTYIADGCIECNNVTITKSIPEYYERLASIVNIKFNVQVKHRPKEIYHPEYDKIYIGQDNIFNSKGLAKMLGDTFGKGSENKKVEGWVYATNLEFIKGVIQGYFDGDGNVAYEKGKGMIRTASVSEQLTSDMIQLLSYVGIFASKCLEKRKEENRGDLHTIQVSRKYAQYFKDEIGFTVKVKAEGLDKVIAYQDREGKNSSPEYIDKIPALGEVIAAIGLAQGTPGQSRNYGRWKKKESIGRETLIKYIKTFEIINEKQKKKEVQEMIELLKQAAYSDVVWDEIVKIDYLDDPKEYVYDFTVPGNDSFMVDCNVLVHNTLNSVHYDSKLALKVNGDITHTTIGDFVETTIGKCAEKDIESHPNDTWLGWIRNQDVQVLSTDEDGKVSWKRVEAVTKHPVVNKDGSNTLVKVILESGRWVIATKAKSFIQRVNNKIVEVGGDEVREGMLLPVAKEHHDNTFNNVTSYIVPSVKISSGTSDYHIDILRNMEYVTKDDEEVIKAALDEDVVYEKVVQVTELDNDRPYVYDLTVEHTRNFNLANGFALKDTFHLSGISAASKAVRGVPRLNELLSVSKAIKSPIMKVFLDETIRTNKKKCLEIMNDIRTIRFKDIVVTSNIFFDPDDLDTTIPEDKGFIEIYKQFLEVTNEKARANLSPWLLRLKLDKAKLKDYNVEMVDLHNVLESFYDTRVSCMFSDDNANELIFRIKLEKQDDVAGDDLLTDLKALEHNIMETVVIKGIPKIENVSLSEAKSKRFNPLTLEFEQQVEWMIYTDGTNIRQILSMDIVDAARTITNDVVEIYEVLGIEAARQVLYNEINEVLDNIYVNYRHIALLVDVMTNKGNILSVNRHGINRGDIGPLAKCSFEESTDKLIKAGVFAEFDKINGVAANVMLGQIAPCGTGDVKIIMDEGRLETINEDDIEVELEQDMRESVCQEGNFKIDFNLPTMADEAFMPKTDHELVIVD